MPGRARQVAVHGAVAIAWTAAVAGLTACTGSSRSGTNDSAPASTAAGITSGASGSPSAETITDVAAELDDVIAHIKLIAPHYDLSVPGGIVLVAQDSQVRSYAFGDARLHPRQPMRVGNRFPIASNSKTLLATVVMQLVDEGELSLDDTVQKWKPGLVEAGDKMTIEDLLSMRSGLFDAAAVPGFDLGTDLTDEKLRDLLDHPLTDPPGSRSRYSNANYWVLGRIVEAAAGRALRTELRDRILQPAGMTHTDVAADLGTQFRLAHGYDEHHRDDTPGDVSGLFGAGQVVGTAADLAAFYQVLYGGGLLAARLVTDMTKPRGTLPRGGPGYGLGTMTFSLECTDAVGHGGEVPGFESLALHNPSTGRTVIAMINQSGPIGIDAVYSLGIDALCY